MKKQEGSDQSFYFKCGSGSFSSWWLKSETRNHSIKGQSLSEWEIIVSSSVTNR